MYLAQSLAGGKSRAQNILYDLKIKMRNEVQSYLELAADYGNAGFLDEAIEVLLRAVEIKKRASQHLSYALLLPRILFSTKSRYG